MVLHEKLQPQWTKPVEMRATSVKQMKIIFSFQCIFALFLFLNISKSAENHNSKNSLNNLHHHSSKWPGFSEKKRYSVVRFCKK